MTRTADVVVVGGGAMGSAAAWHLARQGRDVVLLERFAALHHRGSSHGSARIFRLAYDQPDYVRMAQAALPLWRRLEEASGADLLTVTGGLDSGDPGRLAAIESALRSCGATVERLSAAQVEERWPGVKVDGDALHQPDGGRLDATATVEALHGAAAQQGAELRFEEPAVSISKECVRTEMDEYRAPVVIAAVNAWAEPLLGGLVPLPRITVTQEQPAYFTPHDPDVAWPSFIFWRDPAIYGLGSGDGAVKVGEHHTGTLTTADGRDFQPDTAKLERLRRTVSEILPGVDSVPRVVETCLYATTPTEDFVIERHDWLVVGVGFSGHGFKFVPEVGRRLAALA